MTDDDKRDVTFAEATDAVARLVWDLVGGNVPRAFEMGVRLRMHPQTWEDIAVDAIGQREVRLNPPSLWMLPVDTDPDLPFGEIRARHERVVVLR